MKITITTKQVISLVSTVIIEETLRLLISNLNIITKMDKTFLITVPICLILLLGYWASLYIQEQKSSMINFKSNLKSEIEDTLKDHALRIRLISKILGKNKIKVVDTGLSDEDLEFIGYKKFDVETARKSESEITLNQMSNSNIRGI